jgi:CRP/FNR family transcriptional regulator
MLFGSSAAIQPPMMLRPKIGTEPPPSPAPVFSDQARERFEAGETLYWQGDEATDVFEIIEGALRIVRVLGDGRRVVTGFFFGGELVGVTAGDQYSHSAEAITLTRVRRCRRSRFEREIGGSPDRGRHLLDQLRRQMAATRDQVVLLALKTAEERVSSFLLWMLRRTSGSTSSAAVLHLPMARPDIADYLGLTVGTVSRTMTHLRELGVIVQIDRYTLMVLQPGRLSLLAADDGDDMNEDMLLCAS